MMKIEENKVTWRERREKDGKREEGNGIKKMEVE